jgi:hypothetical protein
MCSKQVIFDSPHLKTAFQMVWISVATFRRLAASLWKNSGYGTIARVKKMTL